MTSRGLPKAPSTRIRATTALPAAAQRAFERWHEALGWQRAVDEALGPLGLTHTQFLVLQSAASALERAQDAVSQQEIADAAGLDRATTSRVVRALDERGFFDRGPSSADARVWRIVLTTKGREAWRQARAVVVRIAEATPR